MIASALGQVKDPSEGEASHGMGEKATWHGLCRKDLPARFKTLFSFESAPAPGTLRESDGTLSSGLPLEDRESVSVQ